MAWEGIMRAGTASAVMTLLVACTTTPSAPTPEENAAKDAYTKCIFNSIARLDDGHSDPVSIAMGVEPGMRGSIQRAHSNRGQSVLHDRGRYRNYKTKYEIGGIEAHYLGSAYISGGEAG
jgi:hypothetical protein